MVFYHSDRNLDQAPASSSFEHTCLSFFLVSLDKLLLLSTVNVAVSLNLNPPFLECPISIYIYTNLMLHRLVTGREHSPYQVLPSHSLTYSAKPRKPELNKSIVLPCSCLLVVLGCLCSTTCSHIDVRGQFAIVQSVLSPYHVESRDATKGTNLGKLFAFPPILAALE